MNQDMTKTVAEAVERRNEKVVAFIRKVRTEIYGAMHAHELSATEVAVAVHMLSVELSSIAMNNPWWKP